MMSRHCLHVTDKEAETQIGGICLWIWIHVPLPLKPTCPLSLSSFCFSYMWVPPASLSSGKILGLIVSVAYSRCSVNVDAGVSSCGL